MALPVPYYDEDGITIYCGDCRDILPGLEPVTFCLTDPPYPNSSGHFDAAVKVAVEVLPQLKCRSMVFWSEIEHPPVNLPLVAVHIWHRTNVNGKIYEPCYEFSPDGIKRRSEIIRGPAIFKGAGAGCVEYLGHPTQKPIHVMGVLARMDKSSGTILDPFMGSGTTLVAAKQLNRRAIGIELEEKYCEIAANRLRQRVFNFEETA